MIEMYWKWFEKLNFQSVSNEMNEKKKKKGKKRSTNDLKCVKNGKWIPNH